MGDSGAGSTLVLYALTEVMAKGRLLTPAEVTEAVNRYMNPPKTEADKWFDWLYGVGPKPVGE